MVTLWYPARKSEARSAPYLDAGVARVVDKELAVATGTFESIRSHADNEATAAAPAGRGYPVVIYSPGFGSWRNASSALTEELVSRGFVVVAIDHPYDGVAVEFPNGKIVKSRPLVAPGDASVLTYGAWYAMVKQLLAVRIADVRFVVDELAAIDAGRNPDAERRALPGQLAGALDLHRIGMFGHSLGGATTAQVMQVDARIRAGLSLDGPIPSESGTVCTQQPLMLIRSVDPAIERLTIASWKSAAPTLCGWHHAVMLPDSGHNDFTDLTIFARQLALTPERRALWSLGTIDAGEALDAERTYVVTFFERWLDD
jgi:predicted dienelactone hydrolase